MDEFKSGWQGRRLRPKTKKRGSNCEERGAFNAYDDYLYSSFVLRDMAALFPLFQLCFDNIYMYVRKLKGGVKWLAVRKKYIELLPCASEGGKNAINALVLSHPSLVVK